MATLYNTKISATYPGLIKTIDNIAITAALKQLTDGSGNATGLYVNTAGDFKVTSILEWGSLKDTGTGVTITQFVTAANGIENFNNDTTVPTSAAVKTYVDAVVTASDLDFLGDSNVGTPAVDLDSQNFSILGTANEIETSGNAQTLTIGLPNNVTISGIFTGTTFSGDLNGTINTATTATTQVAGNNSTKVATTAYVDTLDAASDLDFSGDSGTGDVNLNTQVFAITGTTNQITTAAASQGLSLSLPATVHRNLQGNVTGNVTGNVAGDLTGNVTATSVLANGVTGTTQTASDNSTKIATTAYVDVLDAASDLDITGDTGTGDVNLNTQTLNILGTTNEITTAVVNQTATISLPSNISVDVTGDLTGNADTSTAWQTARDISLTGEATTTISSVNGSANVSGAVTLDNNSVTGKVLTGLPTPAAASVLPADSILDGIGKLQSQINGLAGGLRFMGSWNATTNVPSLSSGGGEATSGTTTGTTVNKLVDSAANFSATVTVGDQVVNQVDGQTALVTNIDSSTTLSLDADIMLTGEAYTIDNTPFLTQGHYYVVSVGGTTSLNGIANWSVGDWAIVGANNEWTQLDHTDVEGVGTVGNIPKWSATGTIADSIMAEAGTEITVSGILSTTTNLNSGSNFAVATNKFTANATTGNVAFPGDLAINTNKFTVNATSGATAAAGTITAPTFSGDLNGTINTLTTAVTQAASNNSTLVATTAYVDTSAGLYLPLAGGTLTGGLTGTTATFTGTVATTLTVAGAAYTANISGASNIYSQYSNNSLANNVYIGLVGNNGVIQSNNDVVLYSGASYTEGYRLDSSGNSTFAGTVTAAQYYKSSTAFNVIGTGSSGEVLLRPTAWNLSTAQSSFTTTLATIGTDATFAGTLDTAGNITATTASTTQIEIETSVGSANTQLLFRNPTYTQDLYMDAVGDFHIYKSAANQFTFKQNGNVGIGTASPDAKFQVEGNVKVGSASGASWTDAKDDVGGLDVFVGSGSYALQLWDDNDQTNPRFVVERAGNVGIGTSDIDFELQVGGTDVSGTASFTSQFAVLSEATTGYPSGFIFKAPRVATSSNRVLLFEDFETYFSMQVHATSTAGAQSDIPIVLAPQGGNVGIGTASPPSDHKLQIHNAAAYARFALTNSSTGVASGDGLIFQMETLNSIIKNQEAGYLTFGTSGRETDLKIDSSGNVGINTSGASPISATLSVTQETTLTTYASPAIIAGGYGVDGYAIGAKHLIGFSYDQQSLANVVIGSEITSSAGYTISDMVFATRALSTNTVPIERMRIESGGNVRVNFNQSGSSGNLYFQDIDNGASMLYIQPAQYVGTAPYNTNYINAANSSNIGFIAGGSEKMRITSGGNVLMGVTSITDATSRGFGNAFSGSGAYGNWTSWGNGSHTHAIFRNATNIVGTITTSSSATAYNTSSDYRLKEDLQDFAGLDMVSKIPVYDFKWKVDESRSYGVMAHELQEVLPDAVGGEKDAEEMQQVDYSKIVPLLVKSIQELKAEVDLLKQNCNCKN